MKTIFEIKNKKIEIDVDATREFYDAQNKIPQDCECGDCLYFYEEFINKPYSIFILLRKFGVDLGKNLRREPTGVWCVRESNGKIVYIFQVYKIIGKFLISEEKDVQYSMVEDGFNMSIKFIQLDSNAIDIELNIEEEK